MSVEDLSRNHDKKILIGSKEYFIETTSGTTGKPLPVMKSSYTRMLESRYLLSCRKKIDKTANLQNGFLLIHCNDSYIANLDIRNDKDKFHDYDKLLDYFILKKPTWAFSTALIARKFFRYVEYEKNIKRMPFPLSFYEITSQALSVMNVSLEICM
jgi:hypothetical protein